MRAAAVLALVFSLVTPPVAWSAAPESSPKPGASALASPAASACALLRGPAKAEKTFSTDWAGILDHQPQPPSSTATFHRADAAPSLSHLDLDIPPLAPRPPPASRCEEFRVNS